jgi:hypothetical protein
VTTIAAVRAALVTVVLVPLKAAGITRCEPRWPGQLNAPCGVVRRTSTPIALGASMLAETTSTFVVGVYVTGADASGQDLLDTVTEQSGATSIVAAIRANPTLGGAVRSAIPAGSIEEETQVLDLAGATYVGVTIPVQITH